MVSRNTLGKNMVAADTNVLVRLMTHDDAKQYKAAAATIEGGAWVSHLVLAEAIWVIKLIYEKSPAQQMALLRKLIDHENLVLEDQSVVKQALAMFETKPKLGFTDCLVLAIAKAVGHTPLATFDKGLAKLDGAVLVR
jgi:predicted nucleic-acid-binding protein